tara:strand:+ start:755 stop:1117 length:363 start_codon:yes stop_codon:yes gene_type:complete
MPTIDLPSYRPLVVPPEGLQPSGGGDAKEEEDSPAAKPPVVPIKPPEIQYIDLPGTEIEVPLPTGEILATAGTTAVVSVAATLTATSVFKWLVTAMKPVIKQAWNRLKNRVVKQSESSSD